MLIDNSLLLILMLTLFSCHHTKSVNGEKHIFYLHGRIVEEQGIKAVSNVFGPYEYEQIIDVLSYFDATVHHEVRSINTDFETFSRQTSDQIDSLINMGIAPHLITVIGASKGAMLAMSISNRNVNPVNYVLLGANNIHLEQENDWKLNGNILGIYEKSDIIAGRNYQYWIDRSNHALKFDQIELNTALGHGFIYRPIPEWVLPTEKWINDAAKSQ